LRSIDFGRARTIVQLGVGTGCITRELLRRLRPDARLISIEVNGVFVDECRQIHDPRLTLAHDCAASLPRILRDVGVGEIDYIVSSLPLAIMDDDLVDRILAVSQASLAPHGMFLQYQYSLKHRSALQRRYREVRLDFTIRNLPPAFVYACSQRPKARRRDFS
jgi:phospholipid N-methyltransferase